MPTVACRQFALRAELSAGPRYTGQNSGPPAWRTSHQGQREGPQRAGRTAGRTAGLPVEPAAGTRAALAAGADTEAGAAERPAIGPAELRAEGLGVERKQLATLEPAAWPLRQGT